MPKEAAAYQIVSAEFVAGAKSAEQLPPPVGVEVAFAGRSNVGKSSLLNALMQRRNLVRTSSTPGCTRHVGMFKATASDGLALTLVDLPGYGFARRSKTERRQWGDLIEGYLFERPTLKAVVLLFDARRGCEAEELELLAELARPVRISRAPLELILVATKLDRLSSAERKLVPARHAKELGRPVVGFATNDPTAAARLWHVLRGSLGLGEAEKESSRRGEPDRSEP